jgi:iron complex transport system permease protein
MEKQHITKNLSIKRNNNKTLLFFLSLSILVIVAFILDIAIGSANITMGSFIKTIFGQITDESTKYIIFETRMPRAVTAIVVGGGLSLSGLLLQTLFHNPLAGPYVLGISSGAGLGVAIYTMTALTFFSIHPVISAAGQAVAAMLGAAMVFMLVLVFSWRLVDTVSLLIIGIMIGALASSVVGILQFFARPEVVHRFVIWTLGSLGSTAWIHLKFIIPVFFLSIVASVFLLKPLDAMLMGEIHARLTGVNVNGTRLMMIIISSVLVGTITAFTGPIGFVGMTVPHIVRLISGKVSLKYVLPGVLLIGPSVMLLCDIISQLPGRAETLPINGVTAFLGAPVVIFLIVRSRKLKTNI